jgi:hypothetical protein
VKETPKLLAVLEFEAKKERVEKTSHGSGIYPSRYPENLEISRNKAN